MGAADSTASCSAAGQGQRVMELHQSAFRSLAYSLLCVSFNAVGVVLTSMYNLPVDTGWRHIDLTNNTPFNHFGERGTDQTAAPATSHGPSFG